MLVCMCCSRWRHQPTWHENLLYGHIGVVLRKSWPPVELRLELIAILRMDQLQRTLVDDVGLSGERWQMGEMCCIVLIMCHISGGVGGAQWWGERWLMTAFISSRGYQETLDAIHYLFQLLRNTQCSISEMVNWIKDSVIAWHSIFSPPLTYRNSFSHMLLLQT